MKIYLALFYYLLPIFSANIQHTKSFLPGKMNSVMIYFVYEPPYVFVPSANDIIQRSFETGKAVRIFRGHSTTVMSLVMSNGSMISCSNDGVIIQWDLFSGGITKTLDSLCSSLSGIYLFNNNLLVSCTTGSKIMDISGKVIHEFESISSPYVYGNVFYTLYKATSLICYQADLTKSIAYNGDVTAVVRSNDSLFVADYGSYKITEFNLSTGELIHFTGTGHSQMIFSLYVSDETIISGAYDDLFIQWNITSKSEVKILICSSVLFTASKYNETAFIAIDDTDRLILCDFSSNTQKVIVEDQKAVLTSVAVYQDFMFTGSNVIQIEKWSISTKTLFPAPVNNTYIGYKMFVISNMLLTCFKSIMLWDIDTSSVVKEIASPDINCGQTYYYLNGFVYVPFKTWNILKYNLTDGNVVLQFSDDRLQSMTMNIIVTDFYLISLHYQEALVRWDCNTGIVLNYQSSSGVFYATFLSFNSKILYVYNYLIYTIDPASFIITPTANSPISVYAMYHDSSSGILFVGGNPPILYGLDSRNGFGTVYKFTGHSDYIYGITSQGNFLYSCGNDATVKQWDLIKNRIAYSFEDRSLSVTSLVLFGDNLLYGTLGGALYEFYISTAFEKDLLSIHTGSVTDIILDEKIIFVSSLDKTISAWKISDSVYLMFRFFTQVAPNCMAFSEGFVYSGNADSSIIKWNNSSGEAIKTYLGHNAVINDVLVYDAYLFSAGSDSLICRWYLVHGVIDLTFNGHSDQVTSLILFNSILFSSSLDKTIISWTVTSGSILQTYKRTPYVAGHVGPINKIKICNGQLFSASSDLTIKQWDIDSGTVVLTYFGHTKAVTCLFCKSNSLFSGSQDFAVFMWKLNINSLSTSVVSSKTDIVKIEVPLPTKIVENRIQYVWYAIPVVVVVILICAIVCFKKSKRFQWPVNNFTLQGTSVESGSSGYLLTSGGTTMFTCFAGMAIPGFLEVSPSSFRLSKVIAKGGGGSIYLADYFEKSETVVAKVIAENYNDLTPLVKLAFDQEITLMDFFRQHKNFAKIIGFCHNPCCILMKYYEKGSLSRLLKSSTFLSTENRTKYMLDTTSAVQFMHSKLILHADLKPDNILIDFESGLFMVLTDFGIAKILSDKYLASQVFEVSNLKGLSARYAAPEVFQRFRSRNLRKIDESLLAGDIFALGVIIYEILTRIEPWATKM